MKRDPRRGRGGEEAGRSLIVLGPPPPPAPYVVPLQCWIKGGRWAPLRTFPWSGKALSGLPPTYYNPEKEPALNRMFDLKQDLRVKMMLQRSGPPDLVPTGTLIIL